MKKQEYIEYEGHRIPVEYLEETGGETWTDKLYRDGAGNFYLSEQLENSLEEILRRLGRSEIQLPQELDLYNSVRDSSTVIRKIGEQAVLKWFVEVFSNDGILKDMLKDAISSYVPRAERDGKARVTAWVPKSIKKQVCMQLELSIAEAIERRKPATRPRAKKASSGGCSPRHFQLEMTTALVSTVMQFASKPDVDHLMEARREVSKFHSHIHSEAALKLAAGN